MTHRALRGPLVTWAIRFTAAADESDTGFMRHKPTRLLYWIDHNGRYQHTTPKRKWARRFTSSAEAHGYLAEVLRWDGTVVRLTRRGPVGEGR